MAVSDVVLGVWDLWQFVISESIKNNMTYFMDSLKSNVYVKQTQKCKPCQLILCIWQMVLIKLLLTNLLNKLSTNTFHNNYKN